MSCLSRLKHTARRWMRDEEGSVAVETLMMAPIMAWAVLSTLVYFDAYRAEYVTQKASLTIADMFSREMTAIDSAYLNGTEDLLKVMLPYDDDPAYRVTVVRYDEDSDAYDSVWSRYRGTVPGNRLSTTELLDVEDQLPILSDQNIAIVVETFSEYTVKYEPMFASALQDFDIETFTVISPRFTEQLCFQKNNGNMEC